MRFRSLVPASVLLIAACAPPPASPPSGSGQAIQGFSLSPRVAGRGTSVEVTLTSHVAMSSPPSLDLGSDVTVEGVSLVDDTHAVAKVDVAAGAALGWRDATVSDDGREVPLGDAFDVVAESIVVAPAAVFSGTVATVTITGTSTSFADGETWPSFGDGVDVLDVQVDSPTSLTATIGVHGDAHGARDVAVTTRDEGVTEYGALDVVPGTTPTFSPSVFPAGSTTPFHVKGLDGSSGSVGVTFLKEGHTAPDVLLTDQSSGGSELSGHARVAASSDPGTRDVIVGSVDGPWYYLADAFEIVATPPDLTNIEPHTELYVLRTVDAATCEVTDTVVARAWFVSYDLPCGSSPPPQAGPMPYDAEGVFPAAPEAEPDNCPPVVTVGAGDRVWLESDDDAIPLYRSVSPITGQVRYESRGLTLDDYRFGELYSLRTEGEADGLPAMTVPDVQPTVPGEAAPLAPDLCGATWSREEDQTVEWTPAGTFPDGYVLEELWGTLVDTGDDGFVGLIPWDDGSATLSGSALTQLEPGEASFSMVTYTDGPAWTLPTNTDATLTTTSSSSFETRWTISLE